MAEVGRFEHSLGADKVLLILQLWLLTTRLSLAVEALIDGDLAHLLLDELRSTFLACVFEVFRLALLVFHI
jgi:hypothetical protein